MPEDKKLLKKRALVPLTNGDKKPRGWMIYTTQATVIANPRGVFKGIKGITEPRKKKSQQVTGFVIMDPRYVDYNPPPEEPKITDYMKFNHNPFDEMKGPEFIDSSYVEEPAYHVCDPDLFNRRKV